MFSNILLEVCLHYIELFNACFVLRLVKEASEVRQVHVLHYVYINTNVDRYTKKSTILFHFPVVAW